MPEAEECVVRAPAGVAHLVVAGADDDVGWVVVVGGWWSGREVRGRSLSLGTKKRNVLFLRGTACVK